MDYLKARKVGLKMNEPKEQFELFSYDETHNINEWDNGNMWICDCPKLQTELFHCRECKAEPPWGCDGVFCVDSYGL